MPDVMRDPVCGMDIPLHDAAATAMTEGRRLYFCCFRCHAAFLDTPHRFIGWAGDPSRCAGSGNRGAVECQHGPVPVRILTT